VPFWVTRRDVFERIGLFREDMLCHEDYELNHRLRRAGGQVILLPWLRSTYFVRPTIRALCRQYGRYGFWKGRFIRSHPASLRARHLAPPALLLSLVACPLWSLFSTLGLWSLSALLLLYGSFLLLASVVIACGAIRDKTNNSSAKAKALPPCAPFLLPMILACLHFCWGAGVWAGIIRGAVKGQPPVLEPRAANKQA